MRTGRIIPSLILFLLLVFPWAFAQSRAPSLEVFLEGGSSFSNSGSGTETIALPCPAPGCQPLSVRMTGSFSETLHPFAGTRYRFTRLNALEASYSYSPYHFVVQQEGQPALAGYNRADLVSFNYVRYLSAKARVQPFLTVGLGINRFSGPSNAPAVVNAYVRADNGWQHAWNYGGGADIVLERHFALRMELRDYLTAQPSGSIGLSHGLITGTSHNLVPSVGVVFRFK
jgi:hypothetical protein